MVLKLEVCSVCKTLLDNYTERRKKEKDDIYKVEREGEGGGRKLANSLILYHVSLCVSYSLWVMVRQRRKILSFSLNDGYQNGKVSFTALH